MCRITAGGPTYSYFWGGMTAKESVDISTTHNSKNRRRVGTGKSNMCRITAGVSTYSYGVA